MPSKKIIDLEGLKKFRQETDQKYVIEGEYSPTTSVGKADVADNLTPYGPNSGADQDTPFVFQSSGGGSDIGSIAQLRELRGNSVVWNQLAQPCDTTYYVANGGTISSSNNVLSFTNTSLSNTGGFEIRSAYKVGIVVGHKYLVKIKAKSTTATSTYIQIRLGGAGEDTLLLDTNWKELDSFITATYTNGLRIWVKTGDSEETDTFDFKEPQVFDLTAIYGAGNEPTTVLEFNRLFPKAYYSYNAGELLSCKVNGIKNVGYNQFDGILNTEATYYKESNDIKVIAGQKYTLEQTETGFNSKTIKQYDGDHNLIKTSYLSVSETSSVVELENNCQFVHIVYDYTGQTVSTPTNVCFHLTWDGSKTGYEPYSTKSYSLPNVELRKVGSVYDTITPNGTLTRKVGVRAYQSGDESDSSVITDLTNTYYVLATPTTEQVAPFVENQAIDDFGTQEFMPTNSALEVQVPQGCYFFYPVDYKAFIDSLGERNDIDYDASKIVSSTQLQTAISQIPTPSIEGTFNVINASDIVNNTLTQAQYDLITNGKPTLINGTFRNLDNPILFSGYATSSYYFGQIQGYYNGEYQYLIYYINLSTKLVELDSSKIAFNLSSNQVILNRLQSVNGKVIPAYPSSTGTFVLKCIDGTLTWVQE